MMYGLSGLQSNVAIPIHQISKVTWIRREKNV